MKESVRGKKGFSELYCLPHMILNSDLRQSIRKEPLSLAHIETVIYLMRAGFRPKAVLRGLMTVIQSLQKHHLHPFNSRCVSPSLVLLQNVRCTGYKSAEMAQKSDTNSNICRTVCASSGAPTRICTVFYQKTLLP